MEISSELEDTKTPDNQRISVNNVLQSARYYGLWLGF
jgi:hypothetical protein